MSMAATPSFRFLALLQREFREYRNSFLWTPVVSALVLAILMGVSVILVNRISVIGDTLLEALLAEGGNSVNVTISVNEDTGEEITIVEIAGVDESTGLPTGIDDEVARIETQAVGEGDNARARIVVREGGEGLLAPPAPPDPPAWEMTVEENVVEEQWNFSREWTFNPAPANGGADAAADADDDMSGRELNVMLGILNSILVLLLLATSVNYLLSTLYDDRKDRSILFWRSMPVFEGEVVISKFVFVLIVAPLIYVAVSLVLQLAYVLLMMALVWRMEQDPFAVVVDNIDFTALMLDPISGWLMTALLIAPAYAWLLLVSAFATRSPVWLAVMIPVGLHLAERFFLGSRVIGDAIVRHVPHLSDNGSLGFYLFGPDWTRLDLASVAAGLLFTAAALGAAVWLRKYRWEIN